jgi:hypothetical protein
LDTLAAEMAELGASLVLAMSPFGYGHDPVGTAAPGKAEVIGAVLPLHAAANMDIETSKVTGRKSFAPRRPRPVSFALARPTALP